MIDLADVAKSLLADCLDDGTSGRYKYDLDLDRLREEISDRSFDAADSACINTHHCADIIAHYESDPRVDTGSADDMGEFKPSQYREAMTAYAFCIARSIIEAEASALVDDLEEAQEHLAEALAGLPCGKLPKYPDRDNFRLSTGCPHGWASHNREDDAGACYWLSSQLDGCNAVAVPAAGVWLSYTWEGDGACSAAGQSSVGCILK